MRGTCGFLVYFVVLLVGGSREMVVKRPGLQTRVCGFRVTLGKADGNLSTCPVVAELVCCGEGVLLSILCGNHVFCTLFLRL